MDKIKNAVILSCEVREGAQSLRLSLHLERSAKRDVPCDTRASVTHLRLSVSCPARPNF